MSDSPNWRASATEQRTAWLIASAITLVIAIALFWPELFESDNPSQTPQSVHQPLPAARTPQPGTPTPAATPRAGTAAKSAANEERKPAQPSPPEGREAAQAARKDGAPARQARAPRSAPKDHPAGRSAHHGKTQPAKAGFYVQTGAFKNKANAVRLATEIRRHGWNAILTRRPGGLYAVWVGPRESRSLAKTLQDTLQLRLHLQGFIVQGKP